MNLDHNWRKTLNVLNSQCRSLQHSSKPQHAVSLHLVGFSSSYTRVTASSTCAGVWFQISHHASILVFIFHFLYPMQLSKESNLSPRSLTLTFFFFTFELPLFFVPAQLSMLIVSNKRVIQDTHSTKLPNVKVTTSWKRFMFWQIPASFGCPCLFFSLPHQDICKTSSFFTFYVQSFQLRDLFLKKPF